MKLLKILSVFLFLVSLQIATAQWINVPPPVEARMNAVFAGGGVPVAVAACADSSCTGFLVCQNFETSTTSNDVTLDNSETWVIDAGTPVTNSQTTPLRGTQSLAMDASDTIYFDIGSQTEVYFFFRFRTATASWPNVKDILKFWDSGGASIGRVAVADNEKFVVLFGGATESSATVFSPDTVYYVWGHFKNGTGNAEMHLYISTTRTKDEAEITVINLTQTTAMRYLTVASPLAGLSYIVDQVLVKTTDIGDVCE